MTDKEVEQELEELRRGDDAVAVLDWAKAAGAYRNAYGLAVTDRASMERQNEALVQRAESAEEDRDKARSDFLKKINADARVQALQEENLRLQSVIVGGMADRNIELADKAENASKMNHLLVRESKGFEERAEKAEALAESAQLLDHEHAKAWEKVNAQLKAEKAALQERIDTAVNFLESVENHPQPNWGVWEFQLREILSPTKPEWGNTRPILTSLQENWPE